MRKGRFNFSESTIDYTKFDDIAGNSAFGLGHPRGLDLKPELPFTTRDLVGVDLTHIIHTSEVAAAKGGPGGGGGGGGGGGTSSFAPYTSGPATASAGYNITIEFKGSWTQDLYNIFVSAADRLTSLIVGELPNVSVRTKGGVKAGRRHPDHRRARGDRRPVTASSARRGRPRSAPAIPCPPRRR